MTIYQQGVTQLQSQVAPQGMAGCMLTLDTSTWVDIGAPLLEAILNISTDGGKTFKERARAQFYGGRLNRHGLPQMSLGMQASTDGLTIRFDLNVLSPIQTTPTVTFLQAAVQVQPK